MTPETPAKQPPPPPPRGVIGQLIELLQQPDLAIERAEAGSPGPALALFVGAVLCAAAYGASAGFFQGGTQIGVAMIKAPVIVLGSVLLCAPSLFVFSSLAGVRLSGRRFVALLAQFSALLGLLLVGFLPVSWLFSASSKSMIFIVFLHLGAWATAIFFAGRFVSRALGASRGGGALLLWLGVLMLVSFQVTTALRPILWRAPEAPFLESGKRFFTDQLGRAADFVEPGDGVDAGSGRPPVIGAGTSEAVSRVPDAGG